MKIVIELFTTETERAGEAIQELGRLMATGNTLTIDMLALTHVPFCLIDSFGVKLGEVTVSIA